MAEKNREVIEIGDLFPISIHNGTPLRSVFCLKNRAEIKKFEDLEDCFILDFNPDDNLQIAKLPDTTADADLRIVAEKGQVACRDYPHPRHSCAKYPFQKMPHDKHCDLCFCYVCDKSAPCKKWVGLDGHCHAFNTAAWNEERKMFRQARTKTS